MARIKGTGVLSSVLYFKDQWGEAGLEKIKAACTGAARDMLARPVLPVVWYPDQAMIDMLLVADKVCGRGDKNVLRAIGRFDAERNLRGVYKMFISLTSPHFLIKNAARVWRQFFDEGDVETRHFEETSGVLVVRNFSDMPLYHEVNQMPFMERALEMCGCRNVRGAHLACLARGDDRCEFRYTWE